MLIYRICRTFAFYVLVFLLIGVAPLSLEASEDSSDSDEDGPAAPLTIAVKGLAFADSLGKQAPRHFDQSAFTATLEQMIRKTRKFDVVTRDQDKLGFIEKEQEFAATDQSQGNAAADGLLLAVDFYAFPTITLFKFASHHRPVPRLENKFHRLETGRLEVQVDVVESDTGRIIGSFTLDDSFSTAETIVNGRGGPPSSARFVGMAKTIGESLASELLQTAYPIVVVKDVADGGPIYLNRGADGGLKKGDQLHLFSSGEALIDPQTGENLGSAEELIGKVEIVSVRPKFATAKIIDAVNASSSGALHIVRGDIARFP